MLLSFGGTKDTAPVIRPMVPMLTGAILTHGEIAPGAHAWLRVNFAAEADAWAEREILQYKLTTIREAPHDANGWPEWERSRYARLKPGDTLHCWWKSRTAERFFIGTLPVLSVRLVTMFRVPVGREGTITPHVHFGDEPSVGTAKTAAEIAAIARDDGFPDTETFWRLFCPRPGIAFDGFVIRWGQSSVQRTKEGG